MAQGNTKGLQAKPSSSKARHAAKAAAATKKGRRHEPPKKPALIKEASMRKVSCAHTPCNTMCLMTPPPTTSQALKVKVTRSIEQQMVSAASAGKLTIMQKTVPESYASLPRFIAITHRSG